MMTIPLLKDRFMSNDILLQKSVEAELAWEPSIQSAHIGVAANEGIVTLSGFVETYGEKHAAEIATRRVKGVKAVVEGLEVRLASGVAVTDQDIAEAALERLAWHEADKDYAVTLKVEKGWLTLSGQVAWHFQKDAAEAAVRHLPGVVGLDNQITITPKVSVSILSDDIAHALHRSWFFDPKTVTVSANGGTVRLSGTATSPHDKHMAAKTAWAAPGVSAVENDIVVV